MKKVFYLSSLTCIIVFVIAFLWWQQNKLDKEKMKSLVHHQPIELNQVEAIHLWENGMDIKKVSTADYVSVIKWFNQYDPNRVSERVVPPSSAQVIIDLENGATIIINYVDERIYINRNDVGSGVEYIFLDDAVELEGFFKALDK